MLSARVRRFDFQPVTDQRIGLVFAQPCQHVLTHFAAQIPQVTDRRRADREAQFDAFGMRIGHQHTGGATVPQVMRADPALELGAYRCNIGDRVEMQKDRAS